MRTFTTLFLSFSLLACGKDAADDTDMVPPGTVVGTTAEGCDCLCDVDGLFRACGAEDCQ